MSKIPQRVPRKKTVEIAKELSEANTGTTQDETMDDVMVEKEEKQAGNGKDNCKSSNKQQEDRTAAEKKKTETVDRRGTFVVTDLSDFNSGIKVCPSARIGTKDDSSDDRRKTFVKPPSTKPEEDRRGTFVVPQNPPECSDHLKQMDNEDQTVYFDTDMDMTEVLNFTQQISTESMNKGNGPSESKSAQDNAEKKSQEENKTRINDENKEEDKKNYKRKERQNKESSVKSDLEGLGTKLEKIKPTNSPKSVKASKEEKCEKDPEGSGKSVVEMRVPKPGNFEYRVSRKQVDGTRQPVPQKPVSRARSKGKVKLSKVTSEVIETIKKTPGKPRNVFDFGDRTPTVTLDPKSLHNLQSEEEENKTGKKETNSSKDLDQNDTKENNKNSKRKDVEKEQRVETTKSVKEPKLLSDNPVYYVPLAKGSPVTVKESGRHSRRSRSKPRSYREVSSDEDEEEIEMQPETAKNRGRSKSRSKYDSGEGEEQRSGRRTRSQSRGTRGDREEEDRDYEPSVVNRQSRGRSRKAGNADGEAKVTKERSSRSRTRKASLPLEEGVSKCKQSDENEEKIDDVEEVEIVRKTRSRSRARSMKSKVEEMENIDNVSDKKSSKTSQNDNEVNYQEESSAGGISSNDKKKERSNKAFLQSLRNSAGANEKEDKQTAACPTSLTESEEKDKGLQKSSKHAVVLPSSSSEEDTVSKSTREGQTVNAAVGEDVSDDKNGPSTAPVKKIKRKYDDAEDSMDDNSEASKTRTGKEIQTTGNVKEGDDVDCTITSRKAVRNAAKEERGEKYTSRKLTDVKDADKTTRTGSSSSLNNDRLSQFVRERGRSKLVVADDDDDITFSDFDKLYQHVSAIRASENSTSVKMNSQSETVKVEEVKEKVEVSQESLPLKTPNMSSTKRQKSATKSKKSSKKNHHDSQSLEKENTNEEVSILWKKKIPIKR